MPSSLTRARKRAGSAAIEAFFESFARAAHLSPKARRDLLSVRVLRDISYSSSGRPEHRLDVYVPRKASAPRPVVVYLHGGGFRMLSKQTHWLMALQFARQGYVVFNADYRLAPAHPFPAGLQDACDAYQWVVEHAARYGGDASRIVLAGESAGGNLVTSLTIAACFERTEPYAKKVFDLGVAPVATVPMCAMLDVSDPEHYWARRDVPQLFRDRIETVCQGYLPHGLDTPSVDLANPLHVLESAQSCQRAFPPIFAGAGTKDPIIEDTERLEQALKNRGVTHDVRYYPGETHAFHAFMWRDNARQAWADTFAFLDLHVPDQALSER